MTLAALLLVTAPQDALPKAGETVSKMIAKYHDAKTLKGDIVTTIRLGDQSVQISTSLQAQRPDKLYIRQSVGEQVYVLTCDGKNFSYNKPVSTLVAKSDLRLMEPFVAGMGLGDVYRAAAESLAERSAPLDLAISDMRDLKRLREQWVGLDLTGEVDWNGEKVYRITGQWRLTTTSPVTANLGLYVTKDGELRRFVLDQLPNVLQDDKSGTVKVSRDYDVHISVDTTVDPKLFTVLK
ncbi:MAG: DUF2092 domain-containing protein [Armatimonadetes bacterium]|nr:DUF2092 domain-containing protein [Armatimonadota bacterium]